ncbi:hypothetical protein PBAL39_01967 [Pedobacter sp. BAL39]|uniref:pectate lyase family protein n=1 Tax=Pedobacter sp. BAL39 TaxID=391596 RepID=UPI0001559B91|nr:hypothetical protein [Pedobacter sp. BAL39]EDM38342.1 hypothetical protein PBAL39_01967 [Pedobacter sp. BAL39]
MSLLLLLVVLTFSKCKKDSDVAAINGLTNSGETSAVSTGTSLKVLNVSTARKDEGYAYKLSVDLGTASDTETRTTASKLRLFEDGKEIGPAHSLHTDIRTKGSGRFSHWSGSLYLSASDNTDPKTNGRKYTYTIDGTAGGSTALPTAPVTPVAPETSSASTSKMIGYAAVDGNTTGGQGGATVLVTSFSALTKALASNSPSIIKVSGQITGTGFLNVKSNTTVLGTKGSSLVGVGLLIYGTNNIIIQNMTIKNVVGFSNIIIKEGAHHVWVDHCDLSSDRNHGWEYYDGLLDVGKRADYVSLSWNRLHDSHIPMLIGFGDENTDDIGHLRTTVYNNYFYNVSERQPSTRFGYMHCFNNYLSNGSGYGIGVTMGATVRTDNNYFENQAVPIYSEYNSKPGYVSGASTNIYKGSGANRVSTAASTWVPAYEYKSVLIPAADVPAKISAGAGAILSI